MKDYLFGIYKHPTLRGFRLSFHKEGRYFTSLLIWNREITYNFGSISDFLRANNFIRQLHEDYRKTIASKELVIMQERTLRLQLQENLDSANHG